MARAKKPAPPEPEVCACGCTPVVAKKKGRGWIVACPALEGCTNNRNAGNWPTRDEAVLDWNAKTQETKDRLAAAERARKRAQKKGANKK